MKFIYLIFFALVLITGISLEWEFLPNRLLRIFTSWAFFILTMVLLVKKLVDPIPFIGLLLLAICDVFLLNWELEFAKPMYYTMHSLASITFLFTIEWKAKQFLLSKFDWLYILMITSILSWVMITLGQFFSEEMNNPMLQVLFYINGFLSVILSVSAFVFSANSTDNYSSHFLLAIVGLTISDLFLFMIYVMDFLDLRFIDNFLNIFGCTLLVNYMIKKQALKKKDAKMRVDKIRDEMADPVTEQEVKMYS